MTVPLARNVVQVRLDDIGGAQARGNPLGSPRLVSDSTILAAQADATIFVVPAGKTSRDNARKATRVLQGVSAQIAGAVLNALDVKREGYYGYYYGHRYYRYGEQSEASSADG